MNKLRKKYKLLIYIGRFQPLHNGHLQTILEAGKMAETVLILIGSANRAPNPKNPWSDSTRATTIFQTLYKLIPDAVKDGIRIMGLKDRLYDENFWNTQVQTCVEQVISEKGYQNSRDEIAIIGHNKDESSYYLKNFPQWGSVDMPNYESINSTDIRLAMFETGEILADLMPNTVVDFLERYKESTAFDSMLNEFKFYKLHDERWSVAPYAPTFCCADALVIQSGHVLFVKRRSAPGKGLWALPGGYLNQNERWIDCAVRELIEETRIKVPEKVLYGSIKHDKTFLADHPNRSLRKRMISQVYRFELEPGPLPKTRAADDAERTKWFQLSELAALEPFMFEDHPDILSATTGVL